MSQKIETGVILGRKIEDETDTGNVTLGKHAAIRSGTIIYEGNAIGENFQTGHNVLVRQNNSIGNDVSLGSFSEIAFDVVIEDGVRVHSSCFIPEKTILRKNSWLGPRVCITNAKYPAAKEKALRGVEVCMNAKIGANVTILPGVRIGTGALVGAGSVVTKDVPENAVCVGNPARVVGMVDELKREGVSVYEYSSR